MRVFKLHPLTAPFFSDIYSCLTLSFQEMSQKWANHLNHPILWYYELSAMQSLCHLYILIAYLLLIL